MSKSLYDILDFLECVVKGHLVAKACAIAGVDSVDGFQLPTDVRLKHPVRVSSGHSENNCRLVYHN